MESRNCISEYTEYCLLLKFKKNKSIRKEYPELFKKTSYSELIERYLKILYEKELIVKINKDGSYGFVPEVFRGENYKIYAITEYGDERLKELNRKFFIKYIWPIILLLIGGFIGCFLKSCPIC